MSEEIKKSINRDVERKSFERSIEREKLEEICLDEEKREGEDGN